MALEGDRVAATATGLVEEMAADHSGHPDATVKTVGVLVAVEYQDPDTGDRRTRSHYRFVEAPGFENCPTYVALGLATQVAQHIGA